MMQDSMTLLELKEITRAYNGFSTILDCDLPQYYKDIFPKHCECGAEMIMTEPGHTQLQCCNHRCWLKMGHRLAYFVSKLGYKGFGEQSALALVSRGRQYFRYPTFLSAFLMSDTEINMCLTEHLASLFIEIKEDIAVKTFQFVDALAALGIPNIGSRSILFDVVKSPVTLIDYILKRRLDALCDICGIQSDMTRYQLSAFSVDIVTLFADVMPNIVNTPDHEVYVAITGKVMVNNISYTRQEFIALCEAIHDNKGIQLYKIIETKAESKLEFVIADESSTSSKYQLGLKLNKLITAQDFYDRLIAKANLENASNESEEDKNHDE